VALYIVGSAGLLTLAGCGHSWLSFEERPPWRREAEVACLQSGALKGNVAITPVKAIEGPGICGADFPLRVSALGEASTLGYSDDPRPPGPIPRSSFPIPEAREPAYPRSSYPQQSPYPQSGYPQSPYPARADDGAGAPMAIHPAGVETEEPEEEPDAAESATPGADPFAMPGARPPAQQQPPGQRPAQAYPSEPYRSPVPLGPTTPSPTGGMATLAPAATLACPIVSALDNWIATAVQPAAQRWFGQPVTEIKQISAYSCRGMNGQPGAHISEHAFGNALDIAAFTLADGRRITVQGGWHGTPEEQGFLRDVQGAACQQFTTVLAPGSNRYHYNHIHVDLMRRSSRRVICEPRAVSGEALAHRLRGEPWSTGSIGGVRRLGFAPERIRAKLPDAVPGDD
jgi:hypothetical protein